MYDTIVIGAGQAGLATGYYLKKIKHNFLIIDKGKEVGESWMNRYDSLVLFTPRMYNSLPGLTLEGEMHGFPTKDEIVKYLKQYVNRFELPIQYQTEVVKIEVQQGKFLIETNHGIFISNQVIVATGAFQSPRIPAFTSNISKDVYQIHSTQYKNPSQLKEGNVLVVGGGNSGAQIAVEISREKETHFAISKKINYLPLVIQKKSIFWWLDKLGILKVSTHSFLGKAIQKKGDPIFGYELKDALKRKNLTLKPKVINGMHNEITFEDQTTLKIQNIIWATGFHSIYPWLKIDELYNADGNIIHQRGVTNVKGLYFIGLPWQHRRGSALIQGVGFDAEFIINHLNDLTV